MEIPDIAEILRTSRKIAFVGCSRDPAKDAHTVPAYMQAQGYRIIPVNPSASEILGEKCYPSLSALGERPDIVDIFRPSNEVMGIVKEILRLTEEVKPSVIWTQLGIEDDEARKLAEHNSIVFVENKCIMVEHRKLLG
ncbi:MAG: CoA-binding protein [Candidatus Aenigmarchaeota archaeon]|nr:CoA-binding protein [Candidatus Aenigmarchaeota archaeon]